MITWKLRGIYWQMYNIWNKSNYDKLKSTFGNNINIIEDNEIMLAYPTDILKYFLF